MVVLTDRRYGFFGGGAIAEAFARRLIASGVARPEHLIVHDLNGATLERLVSALGLAGAPGNRAVAEQSDVLFIAVPPLDTLPVLAQVRTALRDGQLIASLAAGVTTAQIELAIERPLPVVRLIPNLPSWIGQGMNPYCLGRHVNPGDGAQIRALLDVFGPAVEIPEDQMAVATALTAVGPTYVFPIVRALADAATERGLSPDVALSAACQLVAGSAALVAGAGRPIDALASMIGIHTLDEAAARRLFVAAVSDAHAKVEAVTSKVAAAAAAAVAG